MRRSGRKNGSVKGIYGITAPGGAGAKGGKGRKSGKGGAGSARVGVFFAPPTMKKPRGMSKGTTRRSPYKRRLD